MRKSIRSIQLKILSDLQMETGDDMFYYIFCNIVISRGISEKYLLPEGVF